ncbi:hypothetical protein Zm00014a_037099 [Zea mays]|uniref:Uncharacterized protein n=1 Tax=Zea mays TaxID=4577 RepID=A0A3L6DXN5_MAIZE|nr:hypothetical protein Zm00014a_037099 [Zea mays]
MMGFERLGLGDVGQIYFMLPSIVACGKRTHRSCRQGLCHSLLPILLSDACSIPSGDASAGRQRRQMRQRRCRIGPGCRSGDAVILLHVCPISVLYDADWSAIDVSYPSLAPTSRMALATTKMTQSQLLRAGWRTTKTPS